jgi:hypothetical protein
LSREFRPETAGTRINKNGARAEMSGPEGRGKPCATL